MFKIVIEETKEVRKLVGKSWEPIQRDGNHTEYGYTPEVENLVKETREVYMQVVEDLDLVAVIEAVNKPRK